MSSKTQNYILSFITIIVISLVGMVVVERNEYDLETISGIVLIIPSLICIITARFQLGGSFAITPQAKELVTHGLYSKIRNPIYVFGQILILGIILCVRIHLYLVPWALLLVMQIFRAKKEGQVLEEKFGDVYSEYKKKTWF